MSHRFLSLLLSLSLLAVPSLAVAQSHSQLFQQGKAAHAAGNYAEAEAIFRRIIRRDPENVFAYNSLGIALYFQGQLEQAIASYHKAIQLDPNFVFAHNNLGIALKGQGQLEQAIESHQKVLSLPDGQGQPASAHTLAYYGLGTVLHKQGKLEQAIANFLKAIQLDSNHATVYYGLGTVLCDQGKLEQAIANFLKAIQLDPNRATAYYGLGTVLYDQGKLEQAIANFLKAIQLDPNRATAYYGLGTVLYDQGKLEQAIANFLKAIQLDPNHVGTYNNLGIALRKQGKLEQAIESYQKALSLPDVKGTTASAHTLAHNNLGFAFQEQGKLEAAIAEYKLAIALDPDFATAQANLREAQRLLTLQRNPPPATIDDRQYLPSADDEPLVGVLRSTVRVTAEGSEGSIVGAGWVVKRQGDIVWIATNRHVVSDRRSNRPSDKIEVEFFSELSDARRPRYEATIAHITRPDNRDLDLAVLKVTGVPDDIIPLKFREGGVVRNTTVRVIGHPYTVDDPWNSASGEITNYNPDSLMLPINANVAEGNSGGPVVDARTLEVIGMMVRIRDAEDVALDPERPSPNLRRLSSATRGVGLAYQIDVAIEQFRKWRILTESDR